MTVQFIGYGYGLAGRDPSTHAAADTIKTSSFLPQLAFQHQWLKTIQTTEQGTQKNAMAGVKDCCGQLAHLISNLTDLFAVIGGDHSSAIGTWQGAQNTCNPPLKLLWVDAHMDAHNFTTSLTGNIHGMPLATLLGQGPSALSHLHEHAKIIASTDVCLLGVRSYEPAERMLLEHLGVKVIDMDEIHKHGIEQCLAQALAYLNPTQPQQLGLSIDLDAFSPQDAPAVTVPEPNGINAQDFLKAIDKQNNWLKQLVGIEIAEFAPKFDINHKTEQLIIQLLNHIFQPLA